MKKRFWIYTLIITVLLSIGLSISTQSVFMQSAWGDFLQWRATRYYKAKQYDVAIQLFQRSLAARERAVGSHHVRFANTLTWLALAYKSKGLYETAIPLFERSIAIYERAVPTNIDGLAYCLDGFADLQRSYGNETAAKALYERSLELYTKLEGEEGANVAIVLSDLANLYVSQEDYTKAEELYRRSLVIYNRKEGSDNKTFVSFLINFAKLYKEMGDYSKAIELLKRGLSISEKTFGAESSEVANILTQVARILEKIEKHTDKAKILLERGLAIREKVYGTEHPTVADSLVALGSWYQRRGHYQQAQPLFERAVTIYKNTEGEKSVSLQTTLTHLNLNKSLIVGNVQVKIIKVFHNSPAEKLGLQENDVVTFYDGEPVHNYQSLTQRREAEPANGQPRELRVQRNGQEISVMIRPGLIGVMFQNEIKSQE